MMMMTVSGQDGSECESPSSTTRGIPDLATTAMGMHEM